MPNFGEIAQNAAQIWRFFNFSRWLPSAILDSQKFEISTAGPIRRPNMHHRTKFRGDRSNRSGDIVDFRFFKMAAPGHLGFWKFQIFNGWDAQEGRTASACQILAKSLKTRLRYGDMSIFQDGGRPPSWFFKSWKFQLPVPFGGPICVSMPNFAKIGRTIPEIWPIFDFSRWRLSAILDWFYALGPPTKSTWWSF